MAIQSPNICRLSHNALERPIPQSKPLSDFRGPVYTPRQSSKNQYRHIPVTSSSTGRVYEISPWNKPGILVVEQEIRTSGEMTSVPNPVPDTGFRPTQAQVTRNPLSTVSYSLPAYPPSTIFKSALPLSTFSPLPPLLSLAPTPTAKPSSHTATISSSFLEPLKPSATGSDHETSQQPHRLSTPIIILLAVGSGFLLAGIFIIVRVCARPTRRPRPTPSLPILNDSFSDYDKFQTKDSPIFGGPEKVSPFPGNNSGVWSWTQYTQPNQAIPNPVLSSRPQEKFPHHDYPGRTHYPFVGHAHTSSVPTRIFGNSSYLSPMLQARRLPGCADRRSSAPSMSPCLASPQTSLGTLIESQPTKPLDVDGRRALQRTRSKHVPEESGAYPTRDTESYPDITGKRYSQGLAYDGAVVSSPTCIPCVVPHPIAAPCRGGRARIKSTYFAPGSYPRMSNLPTKVNADRPGSTERKYFIQRSESRKDRGTQGLTYTMGLSSPATDYAIPSPQPTLYPDDSLSVVESRSQTQSRKKQAILAQIDAEEEEDRLSLPKIITEVDGSAALGSLMLMDFGVELPAKKGASPFKPLDGTTTSSKLARGPPKKTALRNDEKPPHIPPPPPLPSLAQMAMEYANPQAYADYKSPTYSIYGLYEHERKSSK